MRSPQLQTTNLGVGSSNLFGRARSPINIKHNMNAGKDAMQNKIICMASAWQKGRATRLHEALKLATNRGQHVRIGGR